MLPQPGQFVNIHAHRAADSRQEWVLTSLKVAEYPPGLSSNAQYSVGLHPWDVEDSHMLTSVKRIRDASSNDQVIAIGEAGIDKASDVPLPLQEKAFRLQLEIASDTSLPVIVHAVKANQEIIRIKKSFSDAIPMIIHGFSGGKQLAESLLREGFYISIGERLMHADKLQAALKYIPMEQLFLETDESSVPVKALYELASEILGVDTSILREHMVEKTGNLFRKH